MNRFEEKAAFATAPDLYAFATPPAAAADVVPKQDVIDLTSKMHAGRRARLDAARRPVGGPAAGLFADGARNSPASPEATGLEVDKLNRGFVKNYVDTYLGSIGIRSAR